MAKVKQDTPVKDLVINQGEDTTIQLNIKESDGTTSTYIGSLVVNVTGEQVLDSMVTAAFLVVDTTRPNYTVS